MAVIVSCEHSSNFVPDEYAPLFEPYRFALATHWGYDIGASSLAVFLAERLKSPLFAGTCTRLIADLNRKEHNRAVFPMMKNSLPETEIKAVLKKYHRPYRCAVLKSVRDALARGESLFHFSIHSFTPELEGSVRNADVGLLYDPRRKREKEGAYLMKSILLSGDPSLRVRMNYPYKGTSDGVTAWLRTLYPDISYAGWEIEVNQALLEGDEFPDRLKADILKALACVPV